MTTRGQAASDLVGAKLDEFFWEWLALPEAQKIVRHAVQFAKDDTGCAEPPAPSPSFPALRGSPSARPSPLGSPHARSGPRDREPGGGLLPSTDWSSAASPLVPEPAQDASSVTQKVVLAASAPKAVTAAEPEIVATSPTAADQRAVASSMSALGNKAIPRFWWPKRARPTDVLAPEPVQKIKDYYKKQNIKDGITNSSQLEPIVTEILGLSKYFVLPIFHKIKIFHGIIDSAEKSEAVLVAPSPEPITEQMVISWCNGKIQIDDLVLSFFFVVKKEHNDWIEREDFNVFIQATLLSHPGLDFLRGTQEFQDRFSDTVVCRIFFVYDPKDVGRIYLPGLRRYKPSVIETWQQLADNDDIKMVRDYFSYEHFYVIYCTFWELDSDHDFLLDKDDLLKYDGHALSRRTVDRIFSEIPAKFTSAVPGKMGYEDFIRFLLCDQDRQSDRSMEYWLNMFDLDGDGYIRDHEMKYFYEEQVQRMECLNYDTIPFADVLCQMNDMILPKKEGVLCLSDFKNKRKFAGTFFSLFSSLNKFLAFEHRDPFQSKQQQLDNPTFSDWDRWCADEYLRLAMEEGDEPEDDLDDDANR